MTHHNITHLNESSRRSCSRPRNTQVTRHQTTAQFQKQNTTDNDAKRFGKLKESYTHDRHAIGIFHFESQSKQLFSTQNCHFCAQQWRGAGRAVKTAAGKLGLWSNGGKKHKNKGCCTLLEKGGASDRDGEEGGGRRPGRCIIQDDNTELVYSWTSKRKSKTTIPSLWILAIQKEINDEQQVKMRYVCAQQTLTSPFVLNALSASSYLLMVVTRSIITWAQLQLLLLLSSSSSSLSSSSVSSASSSSSSHQISFRTL